MNHNHLVGHPGYQAIQAFSFIQEGVGLVGADGQKILYDLLKSGK